MEIRSFNYNYNTITVYCSPGPFDIYFSVSVMFVIEDTTETVKCRTAIMSLTKKRLYHITERETEIIIQSQDT